MLLSPYEKRKIHTSFLSWQAKLVPLLINITLNSVFDITIQTVRMEKEIIADLCIQKMVCNLHLNYTFNEKFSSYNFPDVKMENNFWVSPHGAGPAV